MSATTYLSQLPEIMSPSTVAEIEVTAFSCPIMKLIGVASLSVVLLFDDSSISADMSQTQITLSWPPDANILVGASSLGGRTERDPTKFWWADNVLVCDGLSGFQILMVLSRDPVAM